MTSLGCQEMQVKSVAFEQSEDRARLLRNRYNKFMNWFAKNWPDDLPWPSHEVGRRYGISEAYYD